MSAAERESTHMNTIRFLVGPEERVGHWDLDDFNSTALGIWSAGQPVVGIQGDLVLHDTNMIGKNEVLHDKHDRQNNRDDCKHETLAKQEPCSGVSASFLVAESRV